MLEPYAGSTVVRRAEEMREGRNRQVFTYEDRRNSSEWNDIDNLMPGSEGL
jgi:hypothetical protein